jgi:predicted ATPase/DNA-binding XRE family transcriptional regulator
MATEQHAAFGDLLRHARQTAGLTQEELAERAGVSARAVSNLERGINRSPRRDTMLLLADALDLPMDQRQQWERTRVSQSLRSKPQGPVITAQAEHNLPGSLTSFLGRERELEEVLDLFLRPGVRLLTVTGTGGIGKTRFSLEVARRLLNEFPDGVYFVPLAQVANPHQIPAVIAKVLDVREMPGQTVLNGISRYLHDRTALLLLDNLEHLVAGVSDIAHLLITCPALKVLATSRVPLRLQGEQEYQLRPLSDDLSSDLYVERVQSVIPDFKPQANDRQTILTICRRLDGLPLAIELAAARGRILPPAVLLHRLAHPLDILTGGQRDLPERQQTLRATIAWSYALLRPEQQQLMLSLSVFMGGWTLNAAEAMEEGDVLTSLAALVEISLVEPVDMSGATPRYRMLETIREFGLEMMRQSGIEDQARERHARYMVAFVTSAPKFLIGPDQIVWLDRLGADYPNILQALDWCLDHDLEAGLRMLSTLWAFWWLRTPLTLSRQYCDRFLERVDDTIDPATLALALLGAGIITEFQDENDWDLAEARHFQALSILLDLPDPPEGAYWSYLNLGGIARRRGKLQDAEAYFNKTIEFSMQHNQPIGITAGLLLLGNLSASQGNYELALSRYREGLEIARDLRDPFLTAVHLGNIGSILIVDGLLAEARTLLEESLALNRAIGLTRHIVGDLQHLGDVEMQIGNLEGAARLYTESINEWLKIADTGSAISSWVGLGNIALKRGEPEHALTMFQTALPVSRVEGDHECLATAVEGLVMAHIDLGNVERAVQVYAWVSEFRERIGFPQNRWQQQEAGQYIARARQALTPDEFATAWEAGLTLDLDDICPMPTR